MAYLLTDEERQSAKEAFDYFDRNNSGDITIDELMSALNSAGQNATPHEIQKMMFKADKDRNGSVNFDEFCILMKEFNSQHPNQRERLVQAFRVFDKDGNGYISAEELRSMLMSSGENVSMEDVQDLIKEADKNNDSYIHIEEFVDLMTKIMT